MGVNILSKSQFASFYGLGNTKKIRKIFLEMTKEELVEINIQEFGDRHNLFLICTRTEKEE